MSNLDIIRAWKDKTYRNSLSADELAQLPEHPAGAIELTDDELTNVDGANANAITIICTLYPIICTLLYCSLTACTITIYCPISAA